jgi:hypothetical protein
MTLISNITALEGVMNTSYPHEHFHPHQSPGAAIRTVCAYCLHFLVHGRGDAASGAMMGRDLEEHHECAEKQIARKPDVSLPYN